jgi:hypothetical protein
MHWGRFLKMGNAMKTCGLCEMATRGGKQGCRAEGGKRDCSDPAFRFQLSAFEKNRPHWPQYCPLATSPAGPQFVREGSYASLPDRRLGAARGRECGRPLNLIASSRRPLANPIPAANFPICRRFPVIVKRLHRSYAKSLPQRLIFAKGYRVARV